MKTKKEAILAANKLLKKLGKGWQKKVWFNFDWHYSAHFDNVISLYEDFNNKNPYSCFLSFNFSFVEDYLFIDQENYFFKTPQKAIEHALDIGVKRIDNYINIIERAAKSLNKINVNNKLCPQFWCLRFYER